jgi:hypothetical protein
VTQLPPIANRKSWQIRPIPGNRRMSGALRRVPPQGAGKSPFWKRSNCSRNSTPPPVEWLAW